MPQDQVTNINPAELFKGTIVVTVPHMDDATLACGGTIANLPQKQQIHIIYTTDGRGSPAPLLPWRDALTLDLKPVREQEAVKAMGVLGVPEENIHFLSLPDGQSTRHQDRLRQALIERIAALKPEYIFMPFRFDRHADHLALNHVLTTAHQQRVITSKIIEYFVYYRWRLLPAGDVRCYIQPQHLLQVDIEAVSVRKRLALDCFKSQTTCFFSWQTRPNLTSQLLDDVSREPEMFLKYDPTQPGAAVFSHSITRIRLAHRTEPFLKKQKDQLVALWHRGFQRNGR